MAVPGDPILSFWLLFFTKHVFGDFILQTSYQVRNKGIYGHPAGLLHAGITVAATSVALLVLPVALEWQQVAVILGLEGVIHYHQDWLKIKLSEVLRIEPYSAPFWWAFGLDQYFHMLFYVWVYWYLFG